MQIDIQTRGFSLTQALAAYVKRRLKSALQLNDRHILRTQVRLSDINGPKGGIDKRCQVSVEVAGAPNVVIKDTSDNMYNAIDRAAHRVSRSLQRYTRKLRRQQRRPSRDTLFLTNDSIAV